MFTKGKSALRSEGIQPLHDAMKKVMAREGAEVLKVLEAVARHTVNMLGVQDLCAELGMEELQQQLGESVSQEQTSDLKDA